MDDHPKRRWYQFSLRTFFVFVSAPLAARPKRRWYQYSLRTLFIVITLIAASLAWFIVPFARRHAAVVALEQLQGQCSYADAPPDESWLFSTLRKYLPRDVFDDVVQIDFSTAADSRLPTDRNEKPLPYVTDSDLALLEKFTQLRILCIHRGTITDAGLEHLTKLTQLRHLGLEFAQVTGAGVTRLVNGLNQLESLNLNHTPINDADLAQLGMLKQLVGLDLESSQVTDAGLVQLKGLTKLRLLNVGFTRVTNAGVDDLKYVLPSCFVARKVEQK